MKFKQIDGCPVPAVIYDELVEIKQRTGIVYTSVYRGGNPGAAGILKRFGKSTQAWLYRAYWILHLPGYRPANPPGYSTHELFNDGVAFRGYLRGAPLPAYMCGIDSTTGKGCVAAASRLGFDMMLTYPGNPLESQHSNFRKKPKFKRFKNYKKGMSGKRVKRIRWALSYLPDIHSGGKTYLKANSKSGFFGDEIERALTKFQKDHGQKPDGIYGRQTHRQLEYSVRRRKRKLKDNKRDERERKAKAKRQRRKDNKKNKKKGRRA